MRVIKELEEMGVLQEYFETSDPLCEKNIFLTAELVNEGKPSIPYIILITLPNQMVVGGSGVTHMGVTLTKEDEIPATNLSGNFDSPFWWSQVDQGKIDTSAKANPDNPHFCKYKKNQEYQEAFKAAKAKFNM